MAIFKKRQSFPRSYLGLLVVSILTACIGSGDKNMDKGSVEVLNPQVYDPGAYDFFQGFQFLEIRERPFQLYVKLLRELALEKTDDKRELRFGETIQLENQVITWTPVYLESIDDEGKVVDAHILMRGWDLDQDGRFEIVDFLDSDGQLRSRIYDFDSA